MVVNYSSMVTGKSPDFLWFRIPSKFLSRQIRKRISSFICTSSVNLPNLLLYRKINICLVFYKICVLRRSEKKLSGSSQIFDTLFKRISTNCVKKGKRNLSLAAEKITRVAVGCEICVFWRRRSRFYGPDPFSHNRVKAAGKLKCLVRKPMHEVTSRATLKLKYISNSINKCAKTTHFSHVPSTLLARAHVRPFQPKTCYVEE